MSDSGDSSSIEAAQDFRVFRYETFRPFAIRLGFLVPCFPVLTLLTDGWERPDLWLRLLISRILWSAILLAYPVALARRIPRNLLPWVLYASAALLMTLVMRDQIQMGIRIPQTLLTISLLFILIPMLGVPFSWLENALGVGVLLLTMNVQLFGIPELYSFIPRLELVALFLVAAMGFVHQQFQLFLVNQFTYQNKIEEFARKDALTGLCNRRYFLELGERLLRLGVRPKRPASLIMLDLDHFKAVNDRFGHAAGDAVIRESARQMIREVRGTDLVARIGGEEFAILLPETGLETGIHVAERIRKGIEALAIPFEGLPRPLRITASLGLAFADIGTDSLDSLLSKADQALYQSKEGGRNRVVCHDPNTVS